MYQSPVNVPELTWIKSPEKPTEPEFEKFGNAILFGQATPDVRLVSVYANGELIGRHGDFGTAWIIPQPYRSVPLCMRTMDKYRQESECSISCGENQVLNDRGVCWDEVCPSIEYKRTCVEGGDQFICHH